VLGGPRAVALAGHYLRYILRQGAGEPALAAYSAFNTNAAKPKYLPEDKTAWGWPRRS
jgi:hypothetical protein